MLVIILYLLILQLVILLFLYLSFEQFYCRIFTSLWEDKNNSCNDETTIFLKAGFKITKQFMWIAYPKRKASTTITDVLLLMLFLLHPCFKSDYSRFRKFSAPPKVAFLFFFFPHLFSLLLVTVRKKKGYELPWVSPFFFLHVYLSSYNIFPLIVRENTLGKTAFCLNWRLRSIKVCIHLKHTVLKNWSVLWTSQVSIGYISRRSQKIDPMMKKASHPSHALFQIMPFWLGWKRKSEWR